MKSNNKNDRTPAVAGRFYPGEYAELMREVESLFVKASEEPSHKRVQALLSPHAGYIYSGLTAASVFSKIRKGAEYDNVFVVASSHTHSFAGASVYSGGSYLIPGGSIKINETITASLTDGNSIISIFDDPHYDEHSIEVQLPFISNRLAPGFSLIPLILGRVGKSECREIASKLNAYFNARNLFVFSSDFSHYPDYENAKKADELTKQEFLKRDPDSFYKYISTPGLNIPGLVTRMCGWSAGLVYLYLLSENSGVSLSHSGYSNSGDSGAGDLNRVVGYHGFVSELPEINSAHE